MNILHVTASLRDADFIEHELTAVAPEFHLELSPTVQDAAARLEVPGAYDAVLLDLLLPSGDAESIITHVRQKDLPLAVIALLGSGENDPPMQALKAGADDYVVKRPGFVKELPGLLRRTIERCRAQRTSLRVLYAGNVERARRELSAEKRLQLEPAVVSPDGLCRGVNDSTPQLLNYDAVVLEEGFLGVHILRVLRDIVNRAREVPVLMLVDPGHEDLGIQGLSFGAFDYLSKSGNFLLSLPARLRNAAAHRDIVRQKSSLAFAETRLRMLIERVPACVIMLSSEGNFLAINWSGLSLVGAQRAEELVGRNFPDLLRPEEADALRSFISKICQGEADSIQFSWEGLDGKPRRLELHGVPIRRDQNGTMNVLGVLDDLTQTQKAQDALAESQALLGQSQRALQLAQDAANELELRLQSEREKWEAGKQELLLRADAAELARTGLDETLRAEQSRYSELAGTYGRERVQWDVAREELERQAKAVEERCVRLQDALQAAVTRQSELAEMLGNEQTASEVARQELEQRAKSGEEERAQLLDKLRVAETLQSDLAGTLDEKLAEWATARRELEEQVKTAEEARDQIEERLIAAESGHAEFTEALARQQEQWDAARRELELRASSSEEERTRLLERLGAAEALQSDLSKTLDEKLAEWGAARQEFERQLRNATEECGQLQEKLELAQSGHAESSDSLARQQEQWDSARRELEQQVKSGKEECARLVEELRAAEILRSEMAANLVREQEEWSALRQELHQQLRDAEEARGRLQERLEATESDLAEFAETLSRQQAEWEATRQELEQRATAGAEEHAQLLEKLQAAERLRSEMEETHSRRQAEWVAARQDLEQQTRAGAEEHAQLLEKLQAAERLRFEMEETHSRQQAEWEAARQDLEQQARADAEEHAQFLEKLQAADHLQSELTETLGREQTNWETARRDLAQRVEFAENESARLRSQLQAAEAGLSELTELLNGERSQLETARHELEQRAERAEAERQEFERKFHEAESRCTDLVEGFIREQAQWEVSRLALERGARAAEEASNQLKEGLEAALSRQTELADALAREQSDWQSAHDALKRRLEAVEKERDALADRLRAGESLQSESAENFSRERTAWEGACRDLEQRAETLNKERAALELQLRSAARREEELALQLSSEKERSTSEAQLLDEQIRRLESDLREIQAQSEDKRSQWEALFRELEERLGEAESERNSLKEALNLAEAQKDELLAEQGAAQAAWEEARRRLEERLQTVEGELRSSEAAQARQSTLLPEDQPTDSTAGPQAGYGEAASDQDRKETHFASAGSRYLSSASIESEPYRKLLSDTLARTQRDAEDWRRILNKQSAAEREFLEQILQKTETRLQHLKEQFGKELEQLEARLRGEVERSRRLSDFCMVGFSLSTLDGRILHCNDTFAHILGYSSEEEVLAQSDDEPLRMLGLPESSQGPPAAPGIKSRTERCVYRKDGRPVWLWENVVLIPGEGGKESRVERWLVDVTEHHQLYQELRRLRKTEVVVRLAATTVQEFHKLNSAMTQYGGQLLEGFAEYDPRKQKFERIREVVDRAASAADRLVAVIQKPEGEPEPLDLGLVLPQTEPLLRALAGDEIELSVKVEPEVGSVVLGRARFEQVLTALVVSARDSLAAGGTLTIEAMNAGPEQSAFQPSLVLTVSATGYGVLPAQRTPNLDRLIASCRGYLETGGRPGTETFFRVVWHRSQTDSVPH